ncbi:MAG: CPBP family intramembrane glutamic endopeptidase [Candidatus Hydrogenedentota bacterium]
MDKKGTLTYLALAIGGAWLYAGVILSGGILNLRDYGPGEFLMLLIYIFIPAVAALVARRITGSDARRALPTLAPGGWGRLLGVALLPFGVSVIIYTTLTIFGLGRPDWSLGKLANQVEPVLTTMGQSDPVSGGQLAFVALIGVPLLSLVLGVTLYAAVALGNELGWRGFLQPRLMHLGPLVAYIVVALTWALYAGPLFMAWVIQLSPADEGVNEARALLPRFLLMLLALSCILGEILRRSGSLGLASVFLGSFYAQSSNVGAGIWAYLFTHIREPWTGTLGWVSVICWLAAALALVLFPDRVRQTETKEPPAEPQAVQPKPRAKAKARVRDARS